MKSIAIITARGGSKRIPRKNIKNFCGKPIIAYSIEAALQSGIFDTVMVSTDDEEIAGIARQYGAQTPFLRSERTSGDHATTADALLEVLERYAQQGETYDALCCLYPTAPFITAEKLRIAWEKLGSARADSLVPVVRFSFPPQRGFAVNDGRLRMLHPEHMHTRSQDLQPVYHDCGQFYFARVEAFKENKKLFMENCISMILPETEVQDIDTQDDWALAELKFKLWKNKG